jgi:hypothetical protein
VDAAAAAAGSAEEKVETVESAVVVVADSEGSVVDLGAVKAVAVDSAAGGSEEVVDSAVEDTNHLKHTGRVADSEGMEVAVDVAVGVKVAVDKELQSPNLGNFSRM